MNPQSQQPQNVSTSSPQIPSSRIPKILLIILAFIIIAGITTGAYVLGTKKNQLPPAQQQQTSVIPTSTSNETANWKTYTNTKYGYSFKYSDEWYIKDLTCCTNGNNLDAEFLNDSPTVDANSNHRVAVILNDDTEADFINSGNVNGPRIQTQQTVAMEKIDGIAIKKVISTQTVYKDKENTDSAGTSQFYFVLIPLQSHLLRIQAFLEDKNIVNKILSTFKFTDQNKSAVNSTTNETVEHCGSAIGQCKTGYHCILDPNPPIAGPTGDVPGICVKN